MNTEERRQIDKALKTNNNITADIISLAKQQENMIKSLFNYIENLMEIINEENEDDSA